MTTTIIWLTAALTAGLTISVAILWYTLIATTRHLEQEIRDNHRRIIEELATHHRNQRIDAELDDLLNEEGA
jgi:hypothetical protein